MPYDKDKLWKFLIDDVECRTVDEHGSLFSPACPVYAIIAEKMEQAGSHITPRHVYTILNENRNGFREQVLKKYGYKFGYQKPMSRNDDSIESTSMFSASYLDSSNGQTINLKLILSAKNWEEISPKKILSNGRVYWRLQKGWTDHVAERLCQQHSTINCVFSFKNNVVTPTSTAQCYAMFTGICVECNSKITGTILKCPMRDVDVIIDVCIENIVATSHTGDKRRQLKGQRRVNVAEQMIKQNKGAITFCREEARRLKKFGGKNVAIIPKATVLRKAKEQQLLKMYGLEFANAPINLLNEATQGKCAGSIHSIALFKFHCIYWTPEQQQLYKARCKGPDAVLTIDATGGIEKRKNVEDPHVFLYQCMLATTAGSVPVFQMVSADQRSLMIALFLRHILAKGAPRPPIVVCDFGRAIINAVAEIFASCSDLHDYLQKCYDAVFSLAIALPRTYIRLDVSHLISMVAKWQCLKGKVLASRRLYLRCVAQAYQMSDVNILTSFIEAMLAVALSEYLGQSKSGTNVPAQKSMDILNTAIESIPNETEELIESYCDGEFDLDEEVPCEEEAEKVTDWHTWSANVYKSAEEIGEQSKTGSVINGCYNPDFAHRVRAQLLPYLPMWTGVMRGHFCRGSKIATSSSVEGEFGHLKKRVFSNKIPMRIDRFVIEHIEYLEGRVVEASNEADLPSGSSTLPGPIKTPEMSTSITPRPSGDLKNISLTSLDFNHHEVHDSHDINKTDSETQDHISNSLLEIAGVIEKTLSAGPLKHKSDTPEKRKLWNENEDWRGLATVETKKRRKPTYLDPCPEWQFIKDVSVSKLPIFANGNFCGPVTMGINKINIRNTCAFDALMQIIMSSIACNKLYKEKLHKCENDFIMLAKKVLEDKKIGHKHYTARASILVQSPLFGYEEKTRKGTTSRQKLDAECNAAHLAETLFNDLPSYTKTVSCSCGLKSCRKGVLATINVDILLNDGLGKMQKAIDEGRTKLSTCRSCQTINDDVLDYGPHLIIDTSIITDANYNKRNHKITHDLDSVASSLKIQEATYILTGLVDWTPGHYSAYCKSGLYWHEYNDIGPVRKTVSGKTPITPHVILYTLAM